MKTLGFVFYLLVTAYITIYVGRVLFRNGRYFLLEMLHEEHLTDSVNRILLTGYYLLNLGYVSVMLTVQSPADSVSDLIASLSESIGRIMLTLGIMHFGNIAAVTIWNKLSFTNKKPTL